MICWVFRHDTANIASKLNYVGLSQNCIPLREVNQFLSFTFCITSYLKFIHTKILEHLLRNLPQAFKFVQIVFESLLILISVKIEIVLLLNHEVKPFCVLLNWQKNYTSTHLCAPMFPRFSCFFSLFFQN